MSTDADKKQFILPTVLFGLWQLVGFAGRSFSCSLWKLSRLARTLEQPLNVALAPSECSEVFTKLISSVESVAQLLG